MGFDRHLLQFRQQRLRFRSHLRLVAPPVHRQPPRDARQPRLRLPHVAQFRFMPDNAQECLLYHVLSVMPVPEELAAVIAKAAGL